MIAAGQRSRTSRRRRTPRSHQLSLSRYDTDKVQGYLEYYDAAFAQLVEEPITLMEIGIDHGGSLQLWRDYFPCASVIGIDLRVPAGLMLGERIRVYQGDQCDTAFLDAVAREVAPDGYDIVIDDASHVAQQARRSFWHVFQHHLKRGGTYIIEDWGTGYWSDWPDGASAPSTERDSGEPCAEPGGIRSGMVGFVKELIDELGMADLTRGRLDGIASRVSRFESLRVVPGLVFVEKAR